MLQEKLHSCGRSSKYIQFKTKVLIRKCRAFYTTLYQEFFLEIQGGGGVQEGGSGGVGFVVRIFIGVVFVLFGVTGDARLVVLVGVLGADGLMVPVQKLENVGVAVGQGVNAANNLPWHGEWGLFSFLKFASRSEDY